MADAGVSMVLNRLAPLIEKKVREEVNLLLNADQEAQSLSVKLKKIHEVLADAERKGVEDPRVKSWLDKLQEITYDIDGALDEWEVENIRQKIEEDASSHESSDLDSWEKKVGAFLQSVCFCFKQTVQRRTIALDIKGIHERLDSIAQENENEFNFIPNLGPDSNMDFKRIITTSYVDVSEIHGRENDREKLVSKLLLENTSKEGVQTISIVGVGGLGKTTLAQLVFNDVSVKNQFQLKIWVCVSDPFDEVKIAKAILEVVDRNSSSLTQPQALLQSIEKSILRKKFLLVLDDVWEDDDSKWRPLKACLKNGAPGSRILVTTRKTKVAKIMGTTYIHMLEPLSVSYCWSVLSQIAFQEREEAECEMLQGIGWEIAKKCKGLPLAAKTIGGLLRFKASPQEWQDVSREMWGSEEARKDLFPLLTLSYNELHPTVKRCFSYCAIFSKDTTIYVDKLIRIWMAQGFLSLSGNSVREMEQIGRNYFDDLAMRSFFQDFVKNESGHNLIISCKMHDIIHDFVQFLTKNECVIVERVEGGTQVISGQNTRHLTILPPKGNKSRVPFTIWQAEQLRSCFCGTNEIPLNLFSRLRRVRLLSLHACNLKEIPKEIGKLTHIRYLDVSSNSDIKDLPETIYDLYYLHTLDIAYCNSLWGLPARGIQKLINLRHLLNYDISNGFKFPQGFEKLTNLRTLSEFNASSTSGNNLECLKSLNQLGGTIGIRLQSYFDDEVEAKKADLASKKSIQTLRLEVWVTRPQVVEALQPHRNLPILVYEGPHLPNWIMSLTNLRELTLRCIGLENVYSFPPLGELPLLEKLVLDRWWEMKNGGHDFLRINTTAAASSTSVFPKLKVLEIWDCYLGEEWEDISEEQLSNTNISIFPCLRVLKLRYCKELKVLPHRLVHKASSLQFLEIDGCYCLYDRYSPEGGEDWTQLSHIPHVEIM
ncbi:putative disease resistance protein RGA1 [Sesamum alatum]|uniref:Disease resistance protein RGA1 n=1 Tax=Sesamum alatum TaxID=300844 RepID=A0AAE2CKS4_9LAMI|nr:putative disease resistance protein RGA1 [Sesamum alatum]